MTRVVMLSRPSGQEGSIWIGPDAEGMDLTPEADHEGRDNTRHRKRIAGFSLQIHNMFAGCWRHLVGDEGE